MRIPNYLACLLGSWYAGQEATVRTRHGITDWFKIGKGVCQGYILSPCLYNFYAEYIMWNTGLNEAQDRINIVRRNISNLRYTEDTTLMAESEEELKILLMKVKEESETAGSKLNIQKTKIMASGTITSWQIDGKNVETVRDFIFLGSKVTVDGDCSEKIKRCLLLGRKAMTKLDSVLKSRDITLLTKVGVLTAMIFLVVMYGCESWTIKKAEHWGINAFKLWCWRRVLRVSWTARRSNQSILKKSTLNIRWKDWCWNWSSNTLATWCKESIHGKRSWCWEKLRAREGAKRGWDVRMASLTQWTWILSKLREIAKDRKVWCVAVHGVTKSQTQLSEWTTTTAFKSSDLSLGRVCTSTDSTAVIGPLRCLLAGAFLFPILNPDAQQIPTLVTGPPSPVKCVVV